MKKYLQIIILFVFAINAKAQTPTWCWGKGSKSNLHDEGQKVAVDNQGNIYITGSFNSSVIIFGSDTLKSPNGLDEVFVVKYNSTGNVIWARGSLGVGSGQARSLTIDSSGNIYVTGTYNNSIVFDSDTLNNAGFFLLKYDSNGNIQ